MNGLLALTVLIGGILATCTAIPTGRVVGGDDAIDGQFPHQVSLRKDNVHNCGGSILSETHILTAAHCVVIGSGVQPYPASKFSIRVGTVNRFAGGKIHNVKKVIVNQNYFDFLHDTAILVLETPITFGADVKPIEIADSEVPSGDLVRISGWGRLATGGVLPYHLQFNDLKALSKDECAKKMRLGDSDALICLDHPKENGACNGDSGGPAVWNGKLVGIAGFVVGGCGSNNPDGYAKVFYHREWIQGNMI